MTGSAALTQDRDFTSPAPAAVVERVLEAIRANNIDARVGDTAEEARRMVLDLVPEGAEILWGCYYRLSRPWSSLKILRAR